MAWHHRQRHWVLRARLALLADDPASAMSSPPTPATTRRAEDRAVICSSAAAYAAIATARLGEPLDKDALDAVLVGLDECAATGGWLVTAELAAAAAMRIDGGASAERRAGALIGSAGAGR